MPDEPGIPSREELAKLPQWARVAFAARCARRVQPLFKWSWPEAPERHVFALDRAIRLAEANADNASASTFDAATAAATDAVRAYDASRDADAAADASRDARARGADPYDAASAYAAACAAAAAARAAYDATYDAACDARAAAHAARAAASASEPVRAAMQSDYGLLREASEREGWTDKTPVRPEFFGPLWPDGEPKGWPASAVQPQDNAKREQLVEQPPIEIYIDPGDASEQTIREVLESLSDLHRAAGGLGLEFRTEGLSVYAMEGAER